MPVLINAEGRKNIKLMVLAIPGSRLTTIVSHKINRLPPPVPRPVRKPRTVPVAMVKGMLVSIGIGNLHIRSGCPADDEAIR